ncbi:MAG: hypothetical protein WAU52_06650 [Burkholderiales bacterium]
MSEELRTMLERHNELVAELRTSGRLDGRVRAARPLVVINKKFTTSDIPTRSLLVDAAGRPYGVLFLSTLLDHGYMARSVDIATRVKHALGEMLGSVILDPIAQGESGGCSFAVWPWHRTLTAVRGLAYLQRRRILPRVLTWLHGATQRTAQAPQDSEVQKMFREPLARISADEHLPLPSQRLARAGLKRIEFGDWRPRVALQHKDILWNILLPRDRSLRRQFPCGFILIDWAGGALRGIPFINLLELARTSRMPRAAAREELLRHCDILCCEPPDIMSYALASVGSTLANLGHFPEDYYRALFANHLRAWLETVRAILPIPG